LDEIFSALQLMNKKKKPNVTIAKRKQSAAMGEESSTITFPVIKAEDHKNTKIKGKNFNIKVFLLG